ncbi:MAG TPA: transposase, partial [Sphingomicrobium sp.]|nr:transposase [Sphingomicrobium sp.]
LTWLKAMDGEQAHICMEATGRHSLGVALALHDAGHVVSIVNPAQIRDFARTKLGRNKTDKVDAALIREYAELFKPAPWAPPPPAMRRLCELQTVRAGLIGSRAAERAVSPMRPFGERACPVDTAPLSMLRCSGRTVSRNAACR